MSNPIITAIGAAIALAVGAWLKTNPNVSNKIIPWVTLLISILTQVVQAVPPVAAADSTPVAAAPWLYVLGMGLVVGFTTIGLFSWFKNGVMGKVSASTKVL